MERDSRREDQGWHDTCGGLVSLAGIVAGIADLPAVPTQDWADRAAACLTAQPTPTMSIVLVAHVEPNGSIPTHELIGAAVSPSAAATRHTAEPPGAIVPLLRAAGYRLGQLPLLSYATSPDGHIAGPLDTLDPQWRVGALGRLWSQFIPDDARAGVALAAEPLAGQRSRMLVAMIAPTINTLPLCTCCTPARILAAATPWLTRRAVLALGPTRQPEGRWLSPREQEVLELIVQGCAIKDIADALARSPHTVHDHLKALHRKLNCNTRGELIARALGRTSSPTVPDAVIEPKPAQLTETRAREQAQTPSAALAAQRAPDPK